MQESGHYSIAGFFFQLLASADDALKLYFANTDPNELSAVFTLEKLGQDGIISYPNNHRLRMIQYKYSSTGKELEPTDLRDILIAFRRSILASKVPPADIDCYLTTNRPLCEAAKKWFEGNSAKKMTGHQFRDLLHDGIKAKTKKTLPFTRFHPVFNCLKYDRRDLNKVKSEIESVANSHGMKEHELAIGINNLIGLLTVIASSTTRDLNRQQLIEALVCRTDPLSLTCDRSAEIQKKGVLLFKKMQGATETTLHRGIVSEIAKAAGLHPFILVKGEGGCGKTVTVCDSAIENLRTRGVPPGFVLIVKADQLNRTSVQDAVRSWRNQDENPDQLAWDETMKRLEKANSQRPVLTLYIDGVDERHGRQGLPIKARNFLCELIFAATESIRDGMPTFSVVVSCRRESELSDLGVGGFPFSEKPFPFSVSQFTNGDLSRLAGELKSCPRAGRRIRDHLSTRQTTHGVAPSTEKPVHLDRIDIIRHPVFWRCFTLMSVPEQHSFLDGTAESRDAIALSYVRWFFQKVSDRIGDLPLNAAQVAMKESAKRFLTGNPSREADLNDDWLAPCDAVKCPPTHQMPIFDEAVSAGLIEHERGGNNRKWRWNRPWLCEYFARESING
ncbi:hypothetical protein Poly51_37310 [Rubripirellula tenax]|uniref:Uncharacterized protein n=1 Tax=Rubripirellula tenax TaxID=2528015 RepID=A0A5C6F109_9BACT|nr:hypothetical protein Poly51_37310 [Rubripirellula tenax]